VTEAEWLAATDPTPMLEFLNEKASNRKLRLFAVACCERIWELLTDARSRSAINTLSRFADGRASEEEMENEILGAQTAAGAAEFSVWVAMLGRETAERSARSAGQLYSYLEVERAKEVEAAVDADRASNAHRAADHAARCVWGTRPNFAATSHFVSWAAIYAARAVGEDTERLAQRLLVRDIFGNPFRPVTFDPSWITSTARLLAEGIYQDRAFDRMVILADALQDAGCYNDDILNHCRQPGEHVRGCWVVDLLLGKA
jgi:hypothetical protein